MAVFVCLLGQQTHMPGVGNTKRRWKNCWGTDRPILVEHARLDYSGVQNIVLVGMLVHYCRKFYSSKSPMYCLSVTRPLFSPGPPNTGAPTEGAN